MSTINKQFDFATDDFSRLGFGSHSFKTEESSISLPNTSSTANQTSSNNTDNTWGLNHRQVPLALQQTKDSYGLTFFTRPQLNLSDVNLRSDRKFSRLLTEKEMSVQRIVRCLLDPRLQYIGGNAEGEDTDDDYMTQGQVHCPLVDRHNAFIPYFTNNLVSLSGFPDLTTTSYSSKEGPYKEAYSYVDGPSDNYGEYDVIATLRNIQGDPISALAFFWIHYQSKVHEGIMKAYGDFILNREIDYNTRIYRFVLDPSKRFIQRMACTGASYPYALNIGSFYDFDNSKPYNDASQSIQIPFKSLGTIYEDDLIIRSFNDVVSYFHPHMGQSDRKLLVEPDRNMMTRIPLEHLSVFNHRGYPWINPDTYEIEWYVSTEYYQSKINSFYDFTDALLASMGRKG
jgi:hypothetical protein